MSDFAHSGRVLHTFDEPGHAICAGRFHGSGRVGVGAQGEGRGCVAQVLLECFDVVPGLQAVHRIGMAQIVECRMRELVLDTKEPSLTESF